MGKSFKVSLGGFNFRNRCFNFRFVQSTILPQNFLENFGYAPYSGEYTPGVAVASCQYLEHTQTVCRAVSTFGGPTRYGTYLLLILGLLLPLVIASEAIYSRKNRNLYPPRPYPSQYFPHLFAFNLDRDFPRRFRNFFIAEARTKCSLRTIGLGVIAIFTAILITGTALVFSNIDLKTVLIRASSTSAHAQLFKEGTQKLIAQPLGYGLGTAGPASVHFEKFLPENWYLQIGLEIGIAGLVIFLGILFCFLKTC